MPTALSGEMGSPVGIPLVGPGVQPYGDLWFLFCSISLAVNHWPEAQLPSGINSACSHLQINSCPDPRSQETGFSSPGHQDPLISNDSSLSADHLSASISMNSSFVNVNTEDMGLGLEILLVVLLPRDFTWKNTLLTRNYRIACFICPRQPVFGFLQFGQPAVACGKNCSRAWVGVG